MEHVLVHFPESRTVLIDGEESGKTNKVLRVEEGTHTFSLVSPQDYKRDFLKNLPTTFRLSAESVDRLRAVGARLLTASPDYQRLLQDLK